MLTEAEKKWLKERELDSLEYGYYSCRDCEHFTGEFDPWTGYCDVAVAQCPIESPNYKDAAEFEARVAAKLANRCINTRPCTGEPCKVCEARRIKHARLAVEEEMEK